MKEKEKVGIKEKPQLVKIEEFIIERVPSKEKEIEIKEVYKFRSEPESVINKDINENDLKYN